MQKWTRGELREAAIRALIYVRMPEKAADERGLSKCFVESERNTGAKKTLAEFKQDLREQYQMVRLDESRAIALIPKLLKGHENEGPQMLEYVRRSHAGEPLHEEGESDREVERLFTSIRRQSNKQLPKNPQERFVLMITNKTFDEIQIGDTARMQRMLTKEDIDVFGIMSGDMNPTHFSDEYARCCWTATSWSATTCGAGSSYRACWETICRVPARFTYPRISSSIMRWNSTTPSPSP